MISSENRDRCIVGSAGEELDGEVPVGDRVMELSVALAKPGQRQI